MRLTRLSVADAKNWRRSRPFRLMVMSRIWKMRGCEP